MIDYDNPENNDWLAVNQFTVVENRHTRRPDIVLFVNGLPLVIIELKNAADENATIWTAFELLQPLGGLLRDLECSWAVWWMLPQNMTLTLVSKSVCFECNARERHP